MQTPATTPATFVETIAVKRQSLAYALIALGVLLAGLTIYLGMKWDRLRDVPAEATVEDSKPVEAKSLDPIFSTASGDNLAGAVWAALIAVVVLGSTTYLLSQTPGEGVPVHETRVLLMLVGGLAGIFTAALGFVFAWRWQKSIMLWINQSESGEAQWVLAALAIFFAGLVLMFVSVQLGRAEERTSALIRRLMYGTNAALSGLLLLLVLAVVNVIVFTKLPTTVISTAAAFKGLSVPSKDFLKTINQPVRAYLVLPENFGDDEGIYGIYQDCRSLLRSVEDQNSQIKAVFLSPANDAEEIRKMQDRLEIPREQRGEFGIVLGIGDSEQPSSFIPVGQLFSMGEGRLLFQGEARLMTELNFLNNGAQRPVIYFTQSNGEPSLTPAKEKGGRTCVEIARYLNERKFDVKPLFLEPGKPVEVTDAALIVIAAPRIPFSPDQAKMLQQYMQPPEQLRGAIPGRIIAMLPAVPTREGTIAATGLEALGNLYGISIEARRMYTLPNQLDIPVLTVLGTIATSFDEKPMLFTNVRVIQPMQNFSETAGSFPLITNTDRVGVYQDNRYDSNPDEILKQIIKEAQQSAITTRNDKMVSNTRVPFGVASIEVLEKDGQKSQRPRMVVIGSDAMIDDVFLKQPSMQPDELKRLFGKLADWLRERPESMKIESRALGTFSLPKETNEFGMVWLPILLLLLATSGLGFGVWYARRR